MKKELMDLKLPDFMIIGAQKAGTTSLHHLLNRHENVFIPYDELFYFDLDSIQRISVIDNSIYKKFKKFSYSEEEEYLKYYSDNFDSVNDNSLIGEDTTTYLPYPQAPERIYSLLPNIKIIICLRDPVKRTYSHYWHLVSYGKTSYNFEKALRYSNEDLLENSLYKKHIKNWIKNFKKKQFHFIVFEEFTNDTVMVVNNTLKFLDLDSLSKEQFQKTHHNKTFIPRSIKIALFFNNLFMHFGLNKNLIYKLHARLNYTSQKKYPPMNIKTEKYLRNYFSEANKGLDQLIGIELDRYWKTS